MKTSIVIYLLVLSLGILQVTIGNVSSKMFHLCHCLSSFDSSITKTFEICAVVHQLYQSKLKFRMASYCRFCPCCLGAAITPTGTKCGRVCQVFCPSGHVKDDRGCDTCACNGGGIYRCPITSWHSWVTLRRFLLMRTMCLV